MTGAGQQPPRRQCAKCPWRVTTNPREIPDGYDEGLHRGLSRTIAEPASLAGLGAPLQVMACHETPQGAEKPCVGWLVHQLGPGNNLVLRMRVAAGAIDADVETVGEQHACLENTLP